MTHARGAEYVEGARGHSQRQRIGCADGVAHVRGERASRPGQQHGEGVQQQQRERTHGQEHCGHAHQSQLADAHTEAGKQRQRQHARQRRHRHAARISVVFRWSAGVTRQRSQAWHCPHRRTSARQPAKRSQFCIDRLVLCLSANRNTRSVRPACDARPLKRGMYHEVAVLWRGGAARHPQLKGRASARSAAKATSSIRPTRRPLRGMETTRSSGSPWLTASSASDSLGSRAAAIGRFMRRAVFCRRRARMCDHQEHRHAAVLNVRFIKNFDYGTLKSLPVRGENGIDLDATTVRQLKELVAASASPACPCRGSLICTGRDTERARAGAVPQRPPRSADRGAVAISSLTADTLKIWKRCPHSTAVGLQLARPRFHCTSPATWSSTSTTTRSCCCSTRTPFSPTPASVRAAATALHSHCAEHESELSFFNRTDYETFKASRHERKW